jgi:hypothetical protein
MFNSYFSDSLNRGLEEHLFSMEGNSPFEKLFTYYQSISRNLKLVKLDSPTLYTFDRRIKNSAYFFHPLEVESYKETNCFERASHMYMAILTLYPESNPTLLYLDEGSRGIHNMVMFHHDGMLYGVDSSYNRFSPIYFDKDSVFFLEKDEVKETKIENYYPINLEDFLTTVSNLRTEKGIIDFLSFTGQIVFEDYTQLRPVFLFSKIDKNGRLVNELRTLEFEPGLNSFSRRILDFNSDLISYEMGDFLLDDYTILHGADVFFRMTYSSDDKGEHDGAVEKTKYFHRLFRKQNRFIDKFQEGIGKNQYMNRLFYLVYLNYIASNLESDDFQIEGNDTYIFDLDTLFAYEQIMLNDDYFKKVLVRAENISPQFKLHLIDYNLTKSMNRENKIRGLQGAIDKVPFFVKPDARAFVKNYVIYKHFSSTNLNIDMLIEIEEEVRKFI